MEASASSNSPVACLIYSTVRGGMLSGIHRATSLHSPEVVHSSGLGNTQIFQCCMELTNRNPFFRPLAAPSLREHHCEEETVLAGARDSSV